LALRRSHIASTTCLASHEKIYRRSPVSKNTKFHGNKKIIVWAAISYDRAEELCFLDKKENSAVYEEKLCLQKIKRIQSPELIF
jgi:hypothetical protein